MKYFSNKNVKNMPVPHELESDYDYLNHDGVNLYVDNNLKYKEKISIIEYELNEIDILMVRNEIWFKDIDQATLDITYDEKKLELIQKREDLKSELANLNNLLNS